VADGDSDSEPSGADGGGVVSLLGGIEHLFDAAVVSGISPGGEEISDGVEIEHLPEWQRNFVPHYVEQWNVKDRITSHDRVSLPVFTSLGVQCRAEDQSKGTLPFESAKSIEVPQKK
jgi:hypothetical protein